MRRPKPSRAAVPDSDPSDGSAVPRAGASGAGDILGCVVETYQGRGPEIAARLGPLGGVDVHGGAEVDRLVVTIEDSPEQSAIDRLSEIAVIPGVMVATLVYHCDGRVLHEPLPAATG